MFVVAAVVVVVVERQAGRQTDRQTGETDRTDRQTGETERRDRQVGRQSTDRQTEAETERQINEIIAPCAHPGMKRLFRLQAKNGSYGEGFPPTGKKRPRSLRSLGLASSQISCCLSLSSYY